MVLGLTINLSWGDGGLLFLTLNCYMTGVISGHVELCGLCECLPSSFIYFCFADVVVGPDSFCVSFLLVFKL